MFQEKGDICPIGIFDSGIGGLSVLQEINQLLPHESLIYVGDSAHAPYGDRSADYVRKRSRQIADFLIDQGVKALVIACNTATAEAASELRKTLDIPVIGMEPAIKPAAELSKSGVIGVLATQRTINSERLLGLTERYAKNKKVLAQACPGLVEQVENGDLAGNRTLTLLRRYIEPLLAQNADALILGCTHYPFLMPAIRQIAGHQIRILETGRPVARQLYRVLQQNALLNLNYPDNCRKTTDTDTDNEKPDISFYNSSNDRRHHQAMRTLWKNPQQQIKHFKP